MKPKFWEFANELSNEYSVYRKNIMNKFKMPAVEVDVILFLANNPQYNVATDIVRAKHIPKSHVSLAIKGLMERGFLTGDTDLADKKKIRLNITENAKEMVTFGQEQQQLFARNLFEGFTTQEVNSYIEFNKRIIKNVSKRQQERNELRNG